jgi:hypothetical protein
MEVAIGFWIICAVVSGVIANSRGLNGCGYTLLGFILGPFGVLMACVIPGRPAANVSMSARSRWIQTGDPATMGEWLSERKPPSLMPMRKCPECLSDIPAAAKVCRYCQRASEPESDLAATAPGGQCKNGRDHRWVWSDVYDCWHCEICHVYQSQ